MGSDALGISDADIKKAFQSTLPAWGATSTFGASSGGSYISIHAPRMGSDLIMMIICI